MSTVRLPHPPPLTHSFQESELNPHLVSQIGTKTAQECAGRGYCNHQTGHCMCYSKFESSDGKGGPGALGDCAYFDPDDPPMNCSTATPLWGHDAALCSGEARSAGARGTKESESELNGFGDTWASSQPDQKFEGRRGLLHREASDVFKGRALRCAGSSGSNVIIRERFGRYRATRLAVRRTRCG